MIVVQGVDGWRRQQLRGRLAAQSFECCAVVDQELGCRQKRDVTRPGT